MKTAGSLDDLFAYVAKRVRLRQAGRGWVGLCPFHNEKTPSFGLFVGKRGEGRFHCHGCSADGDLGDWLRDVEKEEPGRQRTIVRPPPADIRQPAPGKSKYLGEDPVAWARWASWEYDYYCRSHEEEEKAEVLRISEQRRLLEGERNALAEDGIEHAAEPEPSDAFRRWLASERADAAATG